MNIVDEIRSLFFSVPLSPDERILLDVLGDETLSIGQLTSACSKRQMTFQQTLAAMNNLQNKGLVQISPGIGEFLYKKV